MRKLIVTLACLGLVMMSGSIAIAASSVMEFSLTNGRVTDLEFTSTDIEFSNKRIEQRYGDGVFDGISFSVGAPWDVLVYLQGYTGVGTYTLSGGNQFERPTMIFSAEAGSFWSNEKSPTKLKILSDDGKVITGEFLAPTSYAGKREKGTDIFKGTFTIVLPE